jgi:sortase A
VRRILRICGTLLIAAGLLTLGWAALVWQWQDPFTAAYTTYQQHKLKHRYHKIFERYQPIQIRRGGHGGVSLATERRTIATEAHAYRQRLHEGDPLGRLKVPRLGLNIVAVNGTDDGTLTKGPGRYSGPLPSYVPGEGELIYIAGHRTTFLAPFAHIERLRAGDPVTLELPYATFHYVITRHVIVDADDLAVLKSHHHEVLALQACHPRFFASHRYIAYAKLVRVVPRDGPAYGFSGRRLVAAAA